MAQPNVLDILKKIHGPEYHPAILLAKVAANEKEDTKLRVDCSKTLMPYVAASLKSIEVKADIKDSTGLLRVTHRSAEESTEASTDEN